MQPTYNKLDDMTSATCGTPHTHDLFSPCPNEHLAEISNPPPPYNSYALVQAAAGLAPPPPRDCINLVPNLIWYKCSAAT